MTKTSAQLNRFELYEQAAQSPDAQARFLREIIRDAPSTEPTLGEDFCGTGAISRAWLELDPSHRAACIDHDAAPLDYLRARVSDPDRVVIHETDVRRAQDPVDVIAVLNFSICEFHDRRELVQYLAHARSRLREGGALALDLYGGVDAFTIGESELELRDDVRYVWEQRDANPLTGHVVNAMHFERADGAALRDAFIYDWRLWSIAEMCDAMLEAGFSSIEIYDSLADAMDDDGRAYIAPIESPDDLDDNYVLTLVARR